MERGGGYGLIHEIVGALMADGEAASSAFVLSAQIPFYDDCPFRENAEAGGSVLVDAQRRYAVRDKADLICILFGEAAVKKRQLQIFCCEPFNIDAAGSLGVCSEVLTNQAFSQFVNLVI